ncbi:roundabout homolog 2-like isoform X6 [Dreissena polymorpha]|uniref:roundabout homolog 2-like isoform X6 n=1 Tax=Dreissena polymorpha TaxID=45954 RepID=UPI002263C03B|nr:roundabout homolog 2-like isoform X6 [Dreissena polymorpha]
MGLRTHSALPSPMILVVVTFFLSHGEANAQPHSPDPASPYGEHLPLVSEPNPFISEGPKDTYFAKNLPATLECNAKGDPTPKIAWYHNSRLIEFDELNYNEQIRMLVENTRLFMLQFLHSKNRTYTGEYYCTATNIHGVARSRTAVVNVAVIKDDFREEPEHMTASLGARAVLRCKPPRGDPEPQVKWQHEDKPIDLGSKGDERVRVEKNGDLVIERVTKSDQGSYVCVASNVAGERKSGPAELEVLDIPQIIEYPKDTTVDKGATVQFTCVASGGTDARIVWSKKGGGNRKSWRIPVESMLEITNVSPEDNGTYVCTAENNAGKAEAVAVLNVYFAPSIVIKPSNQIVAVGRTVSLPCKVLGNPEPTIYWETKSSSELMFENKVYADGRMSVADDGTLRIERVMKSDGGEYTCKAIGSNSQPAEATALLTVRAEDGVLFPESDLRPPPIIRFGPNDQTLPEDANAFLRCQATGDPSPTIRWYRNGALLSLSEPRYAIVDAGTFQISSLKIADSGNYTCRAGSETGETTASAMLRVYSQGDSGPDRMKAPPDLTKLPAAPEKPVVSDLMETSMRLSWQLTRITDNTPILGYQVEYFAYGSTKVDNDMGVVTGFLVVYKPILNMGNRDNLQYGPTHKHRIAYRPLTHTITGLDSYTYYEICVSAESGVKTSSCSQPMKIQTGESVPSSAPLNLVINREGDTTILVTWSAPDVSKRNGEIIGYMIKCLSEDGQHNCSRSVNGSTHSLRLENLVAGMNYNIEMAAVTSQGTGKWSSVFAIGPDNSGITKEPWFIGMIGALGGIVWLGLCIFTVWLCRNRQRRKKLKETWYNSGGQNGTDKVNERNGSVARKGYGKKEEGDDSGFPTELNTLLQLSRKEADGPHDPYLQGGAGPHPEMKTFYQQSGPVTPYATTALLQAQALAQARKQGGDQMFQPIGGGCVQHSHSGGSCESNTDKSITTDVSVEMHEGNKSNKSSACDSGNLSDENGMLLKQGRKPSGFRLGQSQNPGVVNWNDVLPPPPTHPPTDGEYLQDEGLYSEIPEDRSRSVKSPAQISACSCPTPHGPVCSPGPYCAAYLDSCNRCQSLRSFDNRPYSPQQLIQLHRQHAPLQGVTPTHTARVPGMQRPGGTPVYMHGYSQPWDSQPFARGQYEYEFANDPRDGGYKYTEPVQDGLIQHPHAATMNPTRGMQRRAPTHIDYNDRQFHYPNSGSDGGNIPGGPPGNYCEGPCRGQTEAANVMNAMSMSASYHRNSSEENSRNPYLEGYKIESPPSSSGDSAYRVCNSGGSLAGSGGDSGRSRSSGNPGRLLQDGKSVPEGKFDINYRHPGFHSRSDSGGPRPCMIDEGYTRNADSPVSADDHDYNDGSDPGTDGGSQRDSLVANWESMDDCSGEHSSSNEDDDADADSADADEDSQFLNEEDFASAVARAAQESGLTVVGSTISEAKASKSAKKTRRHRQQARPPSPGYSTDSNYGTVDIPRNPYPKSQRRRQIEKNGKLRRKGDNSESTQSKDESRKNCLPSSISQQPLKNAGGATEALFTRPPCPPQTSPAPSSYKTLPPSLYRHKTPLEPPTTTNNNNPPTGSRPVFQFSDDIPVV